MTPMKVTVPRTWFEQCYLPSVCISTGADTTETRELTAERHNPIAWVGLIVGLLGVLLLDLILVKRSRGTVPYADGDGFEGRRNTGIVVSVLGGCMVLALFTGADSMALVALLGTVVMIGGLVYIIRNRKLGITTSLSKDGTLVTLQGVHPRFANATTELLQWADSLPTHAHHPSPDAPHPQFAEPQHAATYVPYQPQPTTAPPTAPTFQPTVTPAEAATSVAPVAPGHQPHLDT